MDIIQERQLMAAKRAQTQRSGVNRMGLGNLIGAGSAEPSCGSLDVAYRQPTLAERVQLNIKQYEAEIVKLREIETLLSENPQIEQLINALGSANLRY